MAKKKKEKQPAQPKLCEPLSSAVNILQLCMLGLCPNCGIISKPREFRKANGYACSTCGFEIKADEVRQIVDEFVPFITARLVNFEAWRRAYRSKVDKF